MFMGTFAGNNPASVVCLHEMGWFPLVQSLFPNGSLGLAAVQREFEYFARCGWDNGASRNGTDSPYVSCTAGAGGLVHRLASNGFYNAPWGQLQDQNPHFIIGVHALAVASGDRAAAQRLLPAVLAIADYLEANGLASTGIFTSPASGIANGGACAGAGGPGGANGTWEPACGSSQWYDVVLTGHYDGYNALLAVWALECLQDLMAWLGEGARAAHYGALHARAARVFNELMWSEAHAAYADWIDAANSARFYFFTDVQFKAVWLGVANATQAAAVMGRYDELVAGLVRDFNVTLEDVWGPPCNVVPITNPLEFVLELEAIEPNTPYPNYENGGSFFHTVGYEALARAAVNDSSTAFTSFRRFLYNAYNERGSLDTQTDSHFQNESGNQSVLMCGISNSLCSCAVSFTDTAHEHRLTVLRENFSLSGPSVYALNRGWAQQAYFNTQALVGTDPLNDSLLSAWGLLRAGFGFKTTLSGLVKTNAPAPQLEGATHTFGFMGKDVCVEVVGGVLQRCGGGWW